MDELLERVRRDLHAHAAESQAQSVQMFEEFAARRRAIGDLKRAAYWEAAAERERNVPLPNAPESES
jgi:hypothetical protein